MKKVFLWLVGGMVAILVALAIIGYFAGPQPKSDASQTTTKPDKLAQLNEMLASHNLTLCEVFNWIGSMEAETRKELEEASPDMNVIDRENMLDQVRDLKWDKYRSDHQLPDSVRVLVNGYGLERCK